MKRLWLVLATLWEDLIRNISGPLGIRLRRFYYSRRLVSCGKGLVIDTGVHIHSPEAIRLGSHVWIDKQCILIGGAPSGSANIKVIANPSFIGKSGEIHLGSHVHLGIRCIIQGHGGVVIGDHFTSSANVSIFSYSNDPYRCRRGTLPGPNTHYINTPVQIGQNVWLGLGVSLIGAALGNDIFVMPHSVVSRSISDNSVAGGNPAVPLKPRFTEQD